MTEPSQRAVSALVAVLAAAVLVAIASIKLEGQGPYYDELHQATGAFTWTGSPPEMFCSLHVGRWCLLNMSYSGAIKTNAYGLYLRLSGSGFDLVTWRLLGVGFAAVGLVGFGVLASRTLGAGAMALACAFSILDTSLLVMSRFDWGPVALGAALRFLMLGAWLSTRPNDPGVDRARFCVGLLAGLAVTEKLSSVVLVPVAVLLVAADARPGARARSLGVAGFGLLVGLLPLLGLNGYSLVTHGGLVSLADATSGPPRSWSALWGFGRQYLGLGQGEAARVFTLGMVSDQRLGSLEAGLLIGLSAGIVGTAVSSAWRVNPVLRRAALCVIAYWVIGIEIFLLPATTWAHHWIIGTPFQYVGVALWIQGLRSRAARDVRGALLGIGTVVIALVARVPTLLQTVANLQAGSAASSFDRSFAVLGEFGARKADDAVFVASDWGVATQLYCYSGGRPGIVHQLFRDYQGPDQIEGIWRDSGKRELFVVRLEPPSSVKPDVTRRIEAETNADQRWHATAVPHEVSSLSRVRVSGFVRSGSR